MSPEQTAELLVHLWQAEWKVDLSFVQRLHLQGRIATALREAAV